MKKREREYIGLIEEKNKIIIDLENKLELCGKKNEDLLLENENMKKKLKEFEKMEENKSDKFEIAWKSNESKRKINRKN